MLSAIVPGSVQATGMMTAPLLVVVRCAAAAVAATLALSSARNMCQTWSVCTTTTCPDTGTGTTGAPASSVVLLAGDDEILSQMERGEAPTESMMTPTRPEQIVRNLQKMNRRQLLQLYMDPARCVAPTRSFAPLQDLEGEWEGVLLENRGWVMTWVANLLTHRFFATSAAAGQRRRDVLIALWRTTPPFSWRGKAFRRLDGKGDINGGANRIAAAAAPARRLDCRPSVSSVVVHRHEFDVIVEKTRFPFPRRKQHQGKAVEEESERDSPADHQAMILVYRRHQPWYSPWKTMTDELRMVRVSSTSPSRPTVLLGWGCMAWSGGILNASPFCLYRTDGGIN